MSTPVRLSGTLFFTFLFSIGVCIGTVSAVELNPGDILADLIVIDPDTGAQTIAGVELRAQDNLAFDRQGMLLNIFGGGITSHDLASRRQSTLFPNGMPSSILGLVVAADGRIFAYDDTSVSRIDPQTGQQTILSSGGHFSQINSIAMDSNGDVLIGDRGNKTLFALDPDSGVRATISAGDGIFDIAGIAVDGNGDYIILNERATAPARFLKVDRDSGQQSDAVNGPLQDDQGININTSLSSLADFIIDSNGDFLVAMSQPLGQNAGLFRIDPDTGLTTNLNDERFVIQDMLQNDQGEVFFTALILDGNGLYKLDTGTGEAEILLYQGVVANNIFQAPTAATEQVIYYLLNGLKRITPQTGKIEDVASGGLLVNPSRLVVEADGNLLVVDSTSRNLIRVNPLSGSQNLVVNVPVQFGFADITLGPDQMVYVLPTGIVNEDNRILKINPVSGEIGELPFSGNPLTTLASLAVEPNGNVLVAAGSRIARVSAVDGSYEWIASRDDPGSLIDRPRDLEVSVNGRIYVADSDSRALIAIDPVSLEQSILSEGGYIPTGGIISRPVVLTLVPGEQLIEVNQPPQVSIDGGDRTLPDGNGLPGESINLTATASDSDGTVTGLEWLIDAVVVATGSSVELALPDGATVVTVRATDDDGETASDSITVTVEAPDSSWPAPYNGVTPDPELGLPYNNIGIFNEDDQVLYVCMRVLQNGVQTSLDGIERFGLAFGNLASGDGTVNLVNVREFNPWDHVNENQESPDCSGSFELSTGVYADIIKVGPDILEVAYLLEDPINLVFRETSRTLLYSELPPAEPASLNGTTLTIPAVRVGSATFSITLELLPGTNPIELQLTAASEAFAVGTGASEFDAGVLTIPSLPVGELDYWLELVLSNTSPIVFQLQAAGLN